MIQPVRVLLVEDDQPLAELMAEALAREDIHATIESNGARAIERIRAEPPDAVILDVMLPGADGFTVCRRAREHYAGPVLFLTAREDDVDHVLGLETGGDDYVIKPVRPRVLIARLRALLRRVHANGSDEGRIALGRLVVDAHARVATVDDVALALTTAELDLMLYLTARAGTIVSREQLYRDLRGIEYDGLDRAIDLRVSRVRARIHAVAPDFAPIKTVHGQGYHLARG